MIGKEVLIMKKRFKYLFFTAALGLGLIGASFISPAASEEAGCTGSYADGKTGEIVPCQ